MKRLALTFLLFAVPAMTQGQSRIAGIVTVEGTGVPVGGVQVELRGGIPAHNSTTTTDLQGRFSFGGLEKGRYWLSVVSPDYRVVTERRIPTGFGSRISVDLISDNAALAADLRVQPSASIRGTITDAAGRAAKGLDVAAYRIAYDPYGKPMLRRHGSGTSNPQGEYLIPGLDPGFYYLRAEPPATDKRQFASTYYPGTTDVVTASSVRALGTGPVTADFRMEPSPKTRITGRFINQVDTQEVVRSFLAVPLTQPGAQPQTILNSSTDRRESFVIEGLLPGAYEIFANFPPQPVGGEFEQHSARAHVQVEREREIQLEMPITTGHAVNGKVLVRGRLGRLPEELQLRINLIGHQGGGMGMRMIFPGEDGSFSYPGVSDREYYLSVSNIDRLQPSAYVDTARLNGEDVLHKAFRISRPSTLEITIDPNGGQVRGRVSETATVVLAPVRRLGPNPQYSFKWMQSSADGTFVLAGIRPGEYRLLAFAGVEDYAFLNDDFLAQYERRGTPVRIERGTSAVVNPPVIRVEN